MGDPHLDWREWLQFPLEAATSWGVATGESKFWKEGETSLEKEKNKVPINNKDPPIWHIDVGVVVIVVVVLVVFFESGAPTTSRNVVTMIMVHHSQRRPG